MSVRSLQAYAPMPVRNEINVTSLIDVLLVLVLILMLTAPAVVHRIPLPLGSNSGGTEPTILGLSVKTTGELYLEGSAVNRAQLSTLLAAAADSAMPPVLEIRPEATTRYEEVADVLALAKRSGLPAIRIEGTRAE
ncbi:biopolymer transporter ExbD [Dokdonella sp.]|uniref:ExbD/TolR family protein n=1 Tax=Dokdonella sp. TaxID=2291710 RepID=UPI0026165D8E|nr:biopolymer transporter ExbD [Dokdonella sp.]